MCPRVIVCVKVDTGMNGVARQWDELGGDGAEFGVLGFAAKQWKRMVTKHTFVGPGFTRKPPKYERFIRPMALRSTKAHITHPELKCTFNLDIIGVKKNPNGPMYSSMGVITKGTIIEVRMWWRVGG